MTRKCKAVFDTVNATHEHLTAEQIYELLESTEYRMSLATVYNSLNRLCEDGMLRRLSFAGQSDRYDRISRHDHAVCTNCGAVEDVMFEDLTAELSKASGKSVTGYDLSLFHLCDRCKKSQ